MSRERCYSLPRACIYIDSIYRITQIKIDIWEGQAYCMATTGLYHASIMKEYFAPCTQVNYMTQIEYRHLSGKICDALPV